MDLMLLSDQVRNNNYLVFSVSLCGLWLQWLYMTWDQTEFKVKSEQRKIHLKSEMKMELEWSSGWMGPWSGSLSGLSVNADYTKQLFGFLSH